MPGAGGTREQSTLDAYFHDRSGFWRDIYGGSDVYSVIHQRRLAIALDWVDRLGLTSEASVLEIGCGAGVTAVALAGRGLRVHATDAVPSMVELTRQRARDAGVDARLTADLADVQALGFEDAGFNLVIALGVIPWLASPEGAIGEMARVLKPGGTLIATADNAARLNYALDPIYSPRLAPLRSAVKNALIKLGVRRLSDGGARAALHSLHEFDEVLSAAGLEKVEGLTFGHGPFTFLGRQVFPDRLGVRVQSRLQELGDSGRPRLRSAGSQYIVRARKPT